MAVAVLTRALSSAKRNGALQAAPIAAVALGTAAPLVPAVGDTVTARVLRTQQRLCSVEVLCVGDQKLKSAFLGVIRLQDVRDFAGEQVPIPAPAFYWGVLRLRHAPFPTPTCAQTRIARPSGRVAGFHASCHPMCSGLLAFFDTPHAVRRLVTCAAHTRAPYAASHIGKSMRRW